MHNRVEFLLQKILSDTKREPTYALVQKQNKTKQKIKKVTFLNQLKWGIQKSNYFPRKNEKEIPKKPSLLSSLLLHFVAFNQVDFLVNWFFFFTFCNGYANHGQCKSFALRHRGGTQVQ